MELLRPKLVKEKPINGLLSHWQRLEPSGDGSWLGEKWILRPWRQSILSYHEWFYTVAFHP